MSDQPPAPDSLPNYLADGVPKQDDQTLQELQEWIDTLLEYRDRPLDEADLVDEGEELEDVEDTVNGTIVVKKVSCGKDCSGCPHGPYRYAYRREGDKVVSDYLGKAEESNSV